MTAAENFVRYALDIGAIELVLNGYRLKSGRISSYFFNSGRFCDGESLSTLIKMYAGLLCNKGLVPGNILFGPPYKGIFLVPSIALWLQYELGYNINFSSCRKEEKRHGEGGNIIGCSIDGASVVVVDDVITTRLTALDSISSICEARGRAVAYVIAFDREESGNEGDDRSAVETLQEGCDVPVFSIAKLSDLISVLQREDSQRSKQFLPKILEYQERYGVKQK